MRTDLFDYEAPQELIAQVPVPRGSSRLMILHRASGKVEHRSFTDLTEYLGNDDLVVVNNTRVSARRLPASRPTGSAAEVLLIAPVTQKTWKALVKPGRSLRPGTHVTLHGPDGQSVDAAVLESTEDGGRILELPDSAWSSSIADWGEIPLPPYIEKGLTKDEEERYQTVYSSGAGSAAAPTAGLHFTTEMIDEIDRRGIKRCSITLNVGVGTFRPVRAENLEDHIMHEEFVSITKETADMVNQCNGRVFAIGTTTVRALESSTHREFNSDMPQNERDIRCAPFTGPTRLFINPGYQFRAVDALVTNFHQPRSTLLMMISALAGRDAVMAAYAEAIRCRYRLFSFGDAMLII